MKAFIYEKVPPGAKPSYVSIHAPDDEALSRALHIEDSEGRKVVLHGEEIGQLYRFIKPALAG